MVYHKLEKKGLSDFCLILHNSKQRKSNVREQIEKSLQLSSEKNMLQIQNYESIKILMMQEKN